VLDLGFGTGSLLIEMVESGLSAVGLDPSPEMQRVAARKLRNRGITAPRVRATAQRMPFADRSFDTVVSTFPTWYIVDTSTLHEVARVVDWRRDGAGQQVGRLVVVGLLSGRLGRETRQLSRADERVLSQYRPRANAAGLDVEVVADGLGRWQVPVAVSRQREGQKQGRRAPR
jgi:ubiquinone/menaquinone biosynthesis C-methylase UbiE